MKGKSGEEAPMDLNAALSAMAVKLDVVARLLAADLVKGLEGDEQVTALDKCGLEVKEIANILGKDKHAVHQALYRIRSKRKA